MPLYVSALLSDDGCDLPQDIMTDCFMQTVFAWGRHPTWRASVPRSVIW